MPTGICFEKVTFELLQNYIVFQKTSTLFILITLVTNENFNDL